MHELLLSGLQNDLPAFPIYILFFNNCEYIWRLYMKIVFHNILLLKCSKAPSMDLIWLVCIVHYTPKTFAIIISPFPPNGSFCLVLFKSHFLSTRLFQHSANSISNTNKFYCSFFSPLSFLSTTPSTFLKTKILKY